MLNFRGPILGSLKSPCTTCYRSSIETIALNCLVFEKIAFLHFGDRQTDEQMDSIDALSRSRRLNKLQCPGNSRGLPQLPHRPSSAVDDSR